ncbi:Rgg/GadR/MutR family transcriptional regulator [Lapidilactobacillus achengensis]|uniref:Rgg/GadR/MutR family transcriptional regulator n=1 Tax=Lapidilactobacillus achengensis TaxID=2486000 RepID=A0ABW1UQU7_9LACO|nr:Rgg/GadR/MutR family transcriptional regulator [Lapidilactobacillus achengensis]
MNHSSLIRQPRIERGLSQERLSIGISKRSTLASFEKQGTRISYAILIQYLERMNITLEEYQFLLDHTKVSEKREISAIFYHKSSQSFDENFSVFLNQKYRETADNYYLILKAEYLLIMSKKEGCNLASFTESKQIIQSYLDMISTWGRFELSIFINTMYCFDDDYILLHFKRSIQKMKGYLDNLYYSRDILAFLINGVTLGYERKSKALFDVFQPQLHFLATELKNVEANLIWKVFNFLTTDERYSRQRRDELVAVLDYLGKERLINYLETNLESSSDADL